MRIYLWIFCLALVSPLRGAEIHFNFSDDPSGAVPTNFVPILAGSGQPGVWKTVLDEVPSAFTPFSGQAPEVTRHRVLAQTSEDMTDERFPMLLFTGEQFRNFKFTTRFKLVSGIAEQMAGVVFRYQNSSNYYCVRASGLGNNVRFYKVVNGLRSDPIGPALKVTAGEWHTLAVQCDGTQISFWYDDKLVMPPLGDNSLNQGLLGFRTKSDAVAYFTDAEVVYTPIIPATQAVVNRIVEQQTRLLGLRVYTLQTNDTTRVIASKDPAEIGKEGTDAELKAIQNGAVSFGREKGVVLVTMPLHDRNGDYIAAVRIRLKSFFGETQDNALTRARMIVKQMQEQISSEKDLF
ncbi:MAG TPA: hypothetical protein VL863_10845 [bacterium]|nr:hypothetical protein [bacterium]